MVPPAAQVTPDADLPRNLFFGVEDRRLGGRAGLEDKYLNAEASRRQKLAQQVIDSALQVADAVRTLRRFDLTGNADQVISHLNASLDDLEKRAHNLTAEVEKAGTRYGVELNALHSRDADESRAAINTPAAAVAPQPAAAGPNPAAAEPTPQAPAAAGPKPGPGPRQPHPYDRIDAILFNAR